MKLPILREMNTSRELLDTFAGYNHNLRIGEGEFYDMTNLSSDDFPILSPRAKRGVYASPEKPQGLVAKDSLCYVDGKYFVIKNTLTGESERVDMGLTIDNKPKTLISMGAYVIIMPDKKYINTDPDKGYENDRIEAEFESKGEVKYTLCKVDGEQYNAEKTTISSTAPPITDEMKKDPSLIPLWLDTSSIPHSLKQYSTSLGEWSTIATTYVKIEAEGIGSKFNANDGVSITGVEVEGLADLNASTIIWAKGDNYIVVKGLIQMVSSQNSPITVTRKMPNMDFIIESGNRLWGCRYGLALNGEVVNEIYASKLGDFKNWNSFQGVSTDSYVVSVGTDGYFTGAITHLGYPLFFKENCVHKVYGNYPANYQIQTTSLRGVQKGCERSLAIVNEVLYYKARGGICAYDGSLPVEISSALGEIKYSDAVAGAIGNKYYISMKDGQGNYHLFVYDTLKGMWHREDGTEAIDFSSSQGELYYIDRAFNQIRTVRGTGTIFEDKIGWEAVTGIIGTDSPDKKYISRMDVRMKLGEGARVSFYLEYDSSGVFEYLFTTPQSARLESFAMPIRPKRCDHLRLKIKGEGEVKIFSICKNIEWGSDN